MDELRRRYWDRPSCNAVHPSSAFATMPAPFFPAPLRHQRWLPSHRVVASLCCSLSRVPDALPYLSFATRSTPFSINSRIILLRLLNIARGSAVPPDSLFALTSTLSPPAAAAPPFPALLHRPIQHHPSGFDLYLVSSISFHDFPQPRCPMSF